MTYVTTIINSIFKVVKVKSASYQDLNNKVYFLSKECVDTFFIVHFLLLQSITYGMLTNKKCGHVPNEAFKNVLLSDFRTCDLRGCLSSLKMTVVRKKNVFLFCY